MSGRFLSAMTLLTVLVSCTPAEQGVPLDSADSEVQGDGSEPAARTEKQTENPAKADWAAEFAKMDAVLDLSESEAARLKAAFEAREQLVSAWWDEKGAGLAELERQMAEAAKARDLSGVRQSTARAKPLRNELRELIEEQQSRIRDALSSDHQTEWDAHQLAEKLLDVAEPLRLTDEQADRIRAEAITAVQQSTGEPNPKAAAYIKLEQAVERTVLTRDQRDRFQDIKKEHPLRSL